MLQFSIHSLEQNCTIENIKNPQTYWLRLAVQVLAKTFWVGELCEVTHHAGLMNMIETPQHSYITSTFPSQQVLSYFMLYLILK